MRRLLLWCKPSREDRQRVHNADQSEVTYEVFPLAWKLAVKVEREAYLKSNDRDLNMLAPEERPEPFEESTEDGHLSGAG